MTVGRPLSPASRATGPVAALGPSAEIQTVLSRIARAPGLSGAEREGLTAATATASQIRQPEVRAVALRQVSSTGLFLSRTGDDGLPRWTVMTALRTYGLNLPEAPAQPRPEPKAAPAQNDAALVAQVAQQLARLETARVASAPAPAPAPVQTEAPAAPPAPRPKVDTVA